MNAQENVTRIPLTFDEINSKYTLLLKNNTNWLNIDQNSQVVSLEILKEQLDSLCDYLIDGDFFTTYSDLDFEANNLELTIEFVFKISNEVLILLEYYQQKLAIKDIKMLVIGQKGEK